MATINIFAGNDKTAISIRFIVKHLCKNPQYKGKLVNETDSHQQAGKPSIPAKLKEANDMPYLQACMFEGLRCHPCSRHEPAPRDTSRRICGRRQVYIYLKE